MKSTYISGSVDSGRAEGQLRSDSYRSGVCDGQGWVRGDTEIATGDERSSDGQNLTWGESKVERLGDGSSGTENIQDRLVAGLDGQNRTCGREEDGIGKEMGGSKVCGDADVFHDTSDGCHSRDVDQDF